MPGSADIVLYTMLTLSCRSSTGSALLRLAAPPQARSRSATAGLSCPLSEVMHRPLLLLMPHPRRPRPRPRPRLGLMTATFNLLLPSASAAPRSSTALTAATTRMVSNSSGPRRLRNRSLALRLLSARPTRRRLASRASRKRKSKMSSRMLTSISSRRRV